MKRTGRFKRPNKELNFTTATMLETITHRANAIVEALKEPDPEKRNRLIKFIQTSRLLVGRIVPFKARPHSVANLLLATKIGRAVKQTLKKLRNQ